MDKQYDDGVLELTARGSTYTIVGLLSWVIITIALTATFLTVMWISGQAHEKPGPQEFSRK